MTMQPGSGQGEAGGGGAGGPKLLWTQLRANAPTLLSGVAPSSLAAEQYRKLAVRIEEQVAAFSKPGYVLAVSGTEQGSGKTLTSLNLALALARKGERRVLLVECDLWAPTLSKYLQVDSSALGLSQVLANGVGIGKAAVSVWNAGLDLITAGTSGTVDNLMADRRMREALALMRSRYEIVVLDSPPMLLASGRSLATLAHGVLLVVRPGTSRRTHIEEALSGLQRSKVVGMVFNAVRESRMTSSAYPAYRYYQAAGNGAKRRRRKASGTESASGVPVENLPLDRGGAPVETRRRRKAAAIFIALLRRIPVSGIGAALAVAALLALMLGQSPPAEDPPAEPPAATRNARPSEPVAEGNPSVEPGLPLAAVDDVVPLEEPNGVPETGITSGQLNLRAGPGVEHDIVAVLDRGASVEILERDGDWLHVVTPQGSEGWVSSRFVTPQETETPEP